MQSRNINKNRKNKTKNPRSRNDHDQSEIVIPRMFDGKVETFIKRLTLISSLSTSAASSLIAFGVTRASNVTASAEWASYAVRFLSYRVRRVRWILYPTMTVTQFDPSTALLSVNSSCMFFSTFGANPPTTVSHILADGEMQSTPTVGRQPFTMQVTWNRNPASKLYTSIASTIPALSDFGIAYGSHTSQTIGVQAVATRIFVTYFEYLVEFKDPT